MGRPKVGTRPNEFKYGMALYGAAWPEGDFYFVCGGGGHGLALLFEERQAHIASSVPGAPLTRRLPWNRPVRNFLILDAR